MIVEIRHFYKLENFTYTYATRAEHKCFGSGIIGSAAYLKKFSNCKTRRVLGISLRGILAIPHAFGAVNRFSAAKKSRFAEAGLCISIRYSAIKAHRGHATFLMHNSPA